MHERERLQWKAPICQRGVMSRMRRVLQSCLLLSVLCAFPLGSRASADDVVKVRLFSPDARVDIEGTATLKAQTISGHISKDTLAAHGIRREGAINRSPGSSARVCVWRNFKY